MDRKALEAQERLEQEVVEWTVPQHFSVATPRAVDDGFFDVPAPVVEYVSPASEVLSIPAVAEQGFDVPKLALPVRAVQRAALPEPQLVEQLVEVPTVLSVAVLQQRTAEQICYS